MKQDASEEIGLGDKNATFKVYIANKPSFDFSGNLSTVYPMQKGQLYACGQACGNGWRKVFNVYAKLVFASSMTSLGAQGYNRWQDYRDQKLLQADSLTSLLFSAPNQSAQSSNDSVRIVMGKGYAKTLGLSTKLTWLDEEFALDKRRRLIVCPYFDYRQLSNIKIVRLVELISQIKN